MCCFSPAAAGDGGGQVANRPSGQYDCVVPEGIALPQNANRHTHRQAAVRAIQYAVPGTRDKIQNTPEIQTTEWTLKCSYHTHDVRVELSGVRCHAPHLDLFCERLEPRMLRTLSGSNRMYPMYRIKEIKEQVELSHLGQITI